MSKKIIITVDKRGGAKIEAVGTSGEECRRLTAPFTAILDGRKEVLKPEFYNADGGGAKEDIAVGA